MQYGLTVLLSYFYNPVLITQAFDYVFSAIENNLPRIFSYTVAAELRQA